jgi:predicted metalloendopeptidase
MSLRSTVSEERAMRRALALVFTLIAAPYGLAAADDGAIDVPGIDSGGFDRETRPQDDLFGYVNGGWLRKTEIPADRSSTGNAVLLTERSEQAQRAILDELAARTDLRAGSVERRLGDFHASFMDAQRIEALGAAPIRERVSAIRSVRDKTELVRAMAGLSRVGVAVPLEAYVHADYADSTRHLLYLGQGGLTLPGRDYYLREGEKFEALRRALPGYVEKLLAMAGLPPSDGRGALVLELETRLARGQWPVADVQDISKTANKYAVADLAKASARMPWPVFLDASGLSKVATLNLDQPSYVTALGEALDEVALETWKDYLAFRLADDAAPHLSQAFVDTCFAFRKNISGQQAIPERWKRGVRLTSDAMGEDLGRLYVQRHFPPASKQRMETLVANLLAAMRAGIGRLEWMSEATKTAARVKLDHFKPYIGHPERWRDYSKLEVRRGDHVGNYWRANAFERERQIAKLGTPVDRDEWTMSPQTVNAYYNPSLNKIVFPAAILQPPLFDPAADDAINYGAIGAVIGHEISHGFDDEGRKYDAEGNVRDWWREEDSRAFLARARQLVEQYDAFKPLPDLNVNGEMTLGENIADLSGLAIALQAYRRSLGGQPAPVIGGLSGERRFFIGFAQIWRSKLRDEYMRMIVVSDEHAPGQYRVNGVVANMPEFYEAFDVKPGDRHYLSPERRVKIW